MVGPVALRQAARVQPANRTSASGTRCSAPERRGLSQRDRPYHLRQEFGVARVKEAPRSSDPEWAFDPIVAGRPFPEKSSCAAWVYA